MPLNLVIGYKSRKSPEGASVLICTNDGDAARAVLDAANSDFPVRELIIRPMATKRRTDESAFPAAPPAAQESEVESQESEKATEKAPAEDPAPEQGEASDPIADAPSEDQHKKRKRS